MIIKVRSILIILFIGFNSNFLASQKMEILESIAKEYTVKSFPMLKELLSIPNDASNLDWIEKNIIWCEKQFTSRGFSSRRLQTKRAPLLLVEKNFVQNGETVLIYLQMDGQPVDPSRWDQEDPYKPELKKLNSDDNWEKIEWDKIYNYDVDWRVFARSASDAKGPVSIANIVKLAATATPDPELEPQGFLDNTYGFFVCPLTPLHPLLEFCPLKLAHSLKLDLPKIKAPDSLSLLTI